MNTRQKEIAIECLERLDIYKPYINKFKSKGIPCFFENFAGFYVDQEPELYGKIKEVESTFNCLVYATTHELHEFGETYSMLCVTNDSDSLEDCLMPASKPAHYYAFSYVWNKSNEVFSELGDIIVRSFGGGIKRVG